TVSGGTPFRWLYLWTRPGSLTKAHPFSSSHSRLPNRNVKQFSSTKWTARQAHTDVRGSTFGGSGPCFNRTISASVVFATAISTDISPERRKRIRSPQTPFEFDR